MITTKKVAYNFLASSLGRVIGSFFSLASVAFITRALSVEGYGQYSTILAFLYLFLGIADLGLYTLMLREISRPEADERRVVGAFFTTRIISSIVFLGGASILVFFFPYPKEIKFGVVFSFLGFIFLSLSQILMPIFQKYLKMEKSAIAEIIGRVIQFLLIFLFFAKNLGLFWFLFALVFSSGITFFLNLFFCRKYVHFSLNFDYRYFKKILKLACPIALSIIFTMIYFRGNTILLSLLKTQKDVGFFNLGYRVLENLLFFPAAFVGLIMPFLSYSAVKDIESFRKVMQKTFDVLAMGALPLALGGFFVSPFAVFVFGGKEFSLAVAPLRTLLFTAIFIFFGNLGGNSLIALNRQKKLALIYLAGAIFSLGINLFLIPKYSYNGVAITAFFTEALVTVLMFWLIFKEIRWFPSFWGFFKALFASVVMCLPLSFFNLFQKNPFILSGLFIFSLLLYFLTLFCLGAIKKEEIRDIIMIKKI